MQDNNLNYENIPLEKFEFVHDGDRISDKKFEDKPISYFKDAWIRFRKNRASVIATVIIALIVFFAFITPLFIRNYDSRFMDAYYAKKGPRNEFLAKFGIADGSVARKFSDKGLIKAVAIGMGAEDHEGNGNVTLEEGLASRYQPIIKGSIGEPSITYDAAKKEKKVYGANIDTYLEVGFMYNSIEQSEYKDILRYQEETGIQILYPLIADNEWNFDALDANYWYKTKKGTPVYIDKNGKAKTIEYGEGMVLEDNYVRDADGNPVYYEYTGGGSYDTAQYRVRVLYYNYYQYKNGFVPQYILGTDSQGYDLALRLADGIKLSLLVAVCVSVVNFIIGAAYGAIEGYYGGTVDIVLERVTDVLSGVPFIIVATLFQLHLASKLGPVACLIFAYVLTGWIGTASRVRTQFYRFKNSEYVMAARTLGAKDRRLIWKHIFPNSLGTIVTSAALSIPSVINSESMLSYLGIVKLGTASTTSLGNLLAEAQGIWTNYPHLMICPALVLSLLMICFNLFGNGLRDAFNPSLRGVEE